MFTDLQAGPAVGWASLVVSFLVAVVVVVVSFSVFFFSNFDFEPVATIFRRCCDDA